MDWGGGGRLYGRVNEVAELRYLTLCANIAHFLSLQVS